MTHFHNNSIIKYNLKNNNHIIMKVQRKRIEV